MIVVSGRDRNNGIQPARTAHIDFSVKGLQDTVRWGRHDIAKAAQAEIDAEDAGGGPRYAAYRIWVRNEPSVPKSAFTIDIASSVLSNQSRRTPSPCSIGEPSTTPR